MATEAIRERHFAPAESGARGDAGPCDTLKFSGVAVVAQVSRVTRATPHPPLTGGGWVVTQVTHGASGVAKVERRGRAGSGPRCPSRQERSAGRPVSARCARESFCRRWQKGSTVGPKRDFPISPALGRKGARP